MNLKNNRYYMQEFWSDKIFCSIKSQYVLHMEIYKDNKFKISGPK